MHNHTNVPHPYIRQISIDLPQIPYYYFNDRYKKTAYRQAGLNYENQKRSPNQSIRHDLPTVGTAITDTEYTGHNFTRRVNYP